MTKYEQTKSLTIELQAIKDDLLTKNPSDLMIDSLTNYVSEFESTEAFLGWGSNPPSDSNKVLAKINTKANEFLSFERIAAMVTQANGGQKQNPPSGEGE